MAMANNSINVPQEIMGEIFSWLPIKSFVRFKCLSKSYHSYIHSLESSTLRFKHAPKKLLFLTDFTAQSLDYESTFGESALLPLDFPFESLDRKLGLIMVGSCNGLVCLACLKEQEYPRFLVWNPCTSTCRKVPYPRIKENWNPNYSVGFGYNSASEDYHIVLIYHFQNGTSAIVFSLKANSWRILPVRNKNMAPNNISDRGFFLNENLHWKTGYGRECIIVAFDLRNCKFFEVPSPRIDGQEKIYFGYLGVVRGLLCLGCCRRGANHQSTEIWAMKKYGDVASWVKLVTLADDVVKTIFLSHHEEPINFSLLCGTDNGACILLKAVGNILMKCTPEGKLLQKFNVSDSPGEDPHRCHAIPYTESAVSPWEKARPSPLPPLKEHAPPLQDETEPKMQRIDD